MLQISRVKLLGYQKIGHVEEKTFISKLDHFDMYIYIYTYKWSIPTCLCYTLHYIIPISFLAQHFFTSRFNALEKELRICGQAPYPAHSISRHKSYHLPLRWAIRSSNLGNRIWDLKWNRWDPRNWGLYPATSDLQPSILNKRNRGWASHRSSLYKSSDLLAHHFWENHL